MKTMNQAEILTQAYKNSSISNSSKLKKKLPQDIVSLIHTIGSNVDKQKGVFTVLITLIVQKIYNPSQDIRYHQTSMEGGFSGRTIDTQFITPTLKHLNLPSMAESGWLTRSLEQPYPYNLNYNGKIKDVKVKEGFLKIIDYVQKNHEKSSDVLQLLLFEAIQIQKSLIVKFKKLTSKDKITIAEFMELLKQFFYHEYGYNNSGASKLPVIVLYSIYEHLVPELTRYKGCTLHTLNSHTASDKSTGAAGDIEVYKENLVFEAIEIKFKKEITKSIVEEAVKKIKKHNPQRYYILSDIACEYDKQIQDIVNIVRKDHGCQIILNGIMPTIKYYLRLVNSIENVINRISSLIETDKELKKAHKIKWDELLNLSFPKKQIP